MGAARQYAEAWGRCWRMVTAPGCPLTGAEREQAKRNWAFNMAKMIWRELRQGHLGAAGYQLRHAGLTAADWLRYLRRPRRDRLAGTPADQGGQYVIPDWTRPRRPPVASRAHVGEMSTRADSSLRAPASPASPISGGSFGRGVEPPSECSRRPGG